MKKQVLSLIMAALFVALTTAAASAQPAKLMTAEIPFSFTVGNKTLPAGQYVFSRTSTQWVLVISQADRRDSAITLTFDVTAKRIKHEAQLDFHRYGDQYFLARVWQKGQPGRALGVSKKERAARRNAGGNLAWNAAQLEVVSIAGQ